ncbi:hypothetical protein [Sphingomonas sp. GB1N7]|uniref:hypothetical protein n=1 Tax=Parasphingomonas caseinilytica TaxID=3096158 RepID=UPI002FC8D1A8
MTDDSTQTAPPTDIIQAFETLRGEVSLTRAALEGLTAARERIPDYSLTLGQIVHDLKGVAAGIAKIEALPILRLSQSARTAEIVEAGAEVRAADHAMLMETRDVLLHSIGRVDGIVERGQAADRQWRRVIQAGCGGALAATVLMAILPGAVARSLPASWQVPEWMATRVLRMERHVAGGRLIGIEEATSVSSPPAVPTLEPEIPKLRRRKHQW